MIAHARATAHAGERDASHPMIQYAVYRIVYAGRWSLDREARAGRVGRVAAVGPGTRIARRGARRRPAPGVRSGVSGDGSGSG